MIVNHQQWNGTMLLSTIINLQSLVELKYLQQSRSNLLTLFEEFCIRKEYNSLVQLKTNVFINSRSSCTKIFLIFRLHLSAAFIQGYSSSLWFNLPPSFRQSFISFSCNAVRFSSARSGWPFIISRPLSNLRRSPRFGIPGKLLKCF